MRKLISFFVLLLLSLQGMAADYYWVAGSGTWSNLNNWRLGSPTGGIPGAVPSSADNVIFGAPAGTTGNWIVTVDANVFCNNFTWMPGLPGNPRINRSNNGFIISVSGNVSIRPNVSYDAIALDLVGSTNTTVMANGPANVNMTFNIRKTGGAVVTFADDYVVNGASLQGNIISLFTGGVDVSNRKIAVYSFGSDLAGPRTMNITNATLTLGNVWSAVNAGLVISAAGSNITSTRFYADQGIYHKAYIGTASLNYLNISNCTFDAIEFTNTAGNSEARIATNNKVDTLIFHGLGSIRTSNNEVKYALFKQGGYLGGTGNKVQYAEINGSFGVIDNGTHTFDTLITMPNKNMSIAGTLNINKLLRAGGPPCNGFTEISGNTSGTFNFTAGAVAEIDNVLLTNMKATGPMTPITVNGIDNEGNTGWTIVEPTTPGTTLYWVGGAGDWNDNAHWSNTSGGPGGACLPFINDNVVFNANSGFTAGSNTVTTSANAYCKNMTWTGVTASPVFNESTAFLLSVYGSVVLDPSVTMNAILVMAGELDVTVMTNGSASGNLGFDVRKIKTGTPATVTFTDNWINPGGAMTVPRGGVNWAGRTIDINFFSSGGPYSRLIDITNAVVRVNNWTATGTGHSINSANSFIRAANGFASRLQAYNDVEVDGTAETPIDIAGTNFGSLTFTNTSATSAARVLGNNNIRRLEFKGKGQLRNANNNIDSLIIAPNRNLSLQDATNNRINKYFRSVHPACSGLGEIRSVNASGNTITFGADATVEIDNVYMENVTAAGGGGTLTLPIAFNGADAGGNAGWTINSTASGARYWVGGSGDWNDAAHWSNTSGGPGGACVPTTSNDVFFNANSGFTAASKTVSISAGNAYFRNMDWTGAANSPLLDKNSAWVAECWGNMVLNPDAFINGQIRMMGPDNVTISQSIKGNFDLDIRKTSGGRVTLVNDFSNPNSNIRLTTGGFNMADRTVNVTSVSNFGIDGNIQLDISGANITAINFQYYGGYVTRTLNAANSKITGSVILNGGTYNYISIPGTQTGNCQLSNIVGDSIVFTNPHNASAVGINGSNNTFNYVEYKGSGAIYGTNNTMGKLVFFPGNVYRLNGGSTNTVTGEWFGSGTPCRLTEIRSTTTAQATIVKTSGSVIFDYVRLERSNATGGATFRAKEHSDDLGGNTGWTIDPKDAVAPILGLGEDLELCASAFPYTLNTSGFFGAPGSVYTWSNGSTGETLSVTTPGEYRVSVTFPDGCNVKDTIKISQAVVPVDPIAGDAQVCVGETKTLTNATPGGVWSTSDAAVATVDAAGVVTGVAAGNVTITYTVTSGAGCVNSVTQDITVNALPVVPAITGTPDVCVGSATSLANTLAGGTWTSSNPAVASITTTGVVSGIAAGTATITYEVTNAAGCKSSQTITITVNALPVMTPITGATTVCEGGTTTLSHATAGGVWVSTNIAIAAVDAAGVVTGMSAGTVDITYTVMNAAGCTESETIAVTVSAPPTPAPVTGTTTVCTGNTTTLANADPGGTWSSSNTAVATVSATGEVSGLTAGTATITYTVNHAGGCVTTASATIMVSAPPTVSAITGITNFCGGNTSTLSSATPGGVWSSSNTAVATIDAAGVVTGVATGTATIYYTVTNGNGCTATQSTVVSIGAAPVVAPITGTNSVCVGDFSQLTNTTPGGTWSSSNPAVAAVNASTGMVLSMTTGTATISYTVSNGTCTVVRTTLFTVNTPLIVAPITGNNTVCTGGSIMLSSLTTGGSWASSNPTVAMIYPTGEVRGMAPGSVTITYTLTNSASCSNSATFNLSVQSPTVVPPVTGPTDICVGTSAIFANTTPGGVWTSSNTGVATINAAGNVTGISAGTTTITYTLTEASGCTSAQTATLTVHALPALTAITGATGVCVGSNTTLANTTAGGSWSSSNTAVATIDAAGVVTGVSAGTATITYTYTNAAGCTATRTATVTVNANPSVAAITGITDVCVGGGTTLSIATAGGTWSSGDPAVATIAANGAVTGISAGTAIISYTVTNGSGCVTVRTATVTVHALPVADPITGASAICVGSTTTFTNTTAGGVWSSSNPAVATIDAAGEVTAIAPGTTNIIYTVTNASGCISRPQVALAVNARPVVSPILGVTSVCVGATTSLSSTTTGGVWSSSDPAVATISATGEVSGISAGTATIAYTVTNGAGCVTARTATVTVNALPAVGPITGTTSLCPGASATLANATAGGTWSTSSTVIATVNAAGEVQAVSTGAAVITYTVINASGCEQSVSTTVTVNAIPVVAPIAGTTDVCVGATSTLTNATAGGAWSTSDATVATVDAAGVVTGVSAGTADILYMVTNASGCGVAVAATVTVNDLPVVAPVTGTTQICVDATTTVESATAGGAWSSSNTAIATVDAAGLVTGISAGTATITYTVTNAAGCVATQTAVVTVDALPVADPVTGTLDVCVGATTTLATTSTGGAWSSSNTAIATVDAAGIVTGVDAGVSTITYTVTNSAGCIATQAVNVTVDALPVVAPVTGTTDVCVGATSTLASTTTGGVWTSSSTAIATVDASGVVRGVSAGTATITYTVTNAAGCATAVTATVTVNALPTVAAITGSTDVCISGTTTLTNTTAGGTWTSSNPTVATIAANGEVTALTAGTTTITYTVGTGCTASATATVTVSALPTVGAITGATILCDNATTTLTSTTAGGTWTSSNPAVATIATNGEVTGITAGTTTITYTVTNGAGCTASQTTTVTVNGCIPQIPPVAVNDAVSTYQDQAVIISVAQNDTQDNGALDLSSVRIVTMPVSGTVAVLPDGAVRYTPSPEFAGTDQFTYTIGNTYNLTSNVATVTVTVSEMPVAVNDTVNIRPDDRTAIPVLTNDKGTLDHTTIVISRQPARGTLTVNADGTVTFAPQPGFKGGESFRYRVRDAQGTLSNEAEVVIYVSEGDFFIPNAITPNGDGLNDRFVIPDLHKFRSVSLTIFNRWGNEVYHNKQYDNRWDGSSLSGGTYYYILKVDGPQGAKVIKGWIQLLK
ncbi:Ig-like domain-containing protein [Chitinophaga lutea]